MVIYWYDDENGVIIPQVTKVDESTGKVSTVVTHFSKLVLSNTSIQNETINIAFVIDGYYCDRSSLDTFQTNITNTILELRKQANIKTIFVDNNEENPRQIQNCYFNKVENPTTATNYDVTARINNVFNNIEPLGNVPSGEEETIRICTEALNKGRKELRDENNVSNVNGSAPKTYALPYTQWYGYFLDNNSILLDMKDSIGLIVGRTIGYYEDQPIAYNESDILPLVKFLLRGDHSLVKFEKTGKKSWELKQGGDNNVNDVIVLQKVLACRGYLDLPVDAYGNPLPFGTFDDKTENAVMRYKNLNGMTPTGTVDKNTWTSLSLPWDSENDEPLRNRYEYFTVLNTNIYDLGYPSVELELPENGRNVKVGDTVKISATGKNCNSIQLFVNGEYVTLSIGNELEVDYEIQTSGILSIQVKACNKLTPYGVEIVSSEVATINGIIDTNYVFYSAYDEEKLISRNFETAAKAAGMLLEKTYGKTATLYACGSAFEFQQKWNEMADRGVEVDEIIIISHGTPDEIKLFNSNHDASNIVKNEINYEGAIDVWIGDLEDANIEVLNIFACNAGYLGSTGIDTNNVANSFLTNITGIKKVYAYDGYVKPFTGGFFLAFKGKIWEDKEYFAERRPKGRYMYTLDENNEIHAESVNSLVWY